MIYVLLPVLSHTDMMDHTYETVPSTTVPLYLYRIGTAIHASASCLFCMVHAICYDYAPSGDDQSPNVLRIANVQCPMWLTISLCTVTRL